MQSVLFAQLGMAHTYVQVPASAMTDYAWGYDERNRPTRINPGVPATAHTLFNKTGSTNGLALMRRFRRSEKLVSCSWQTKTTRFPPASRLRTLSCNK